MRYRDLFLPLLMTGALAGCDESLAPMGPDVPAPGPDLDVTASSGRRYYLEPFTVVREGGPALTRIIPLDSLDRSRYMEPFTLHVVKTGDVRGSVVIDSLTVFRLNRVTAGDSVSKRVAIDSTSSLVLTTSGPAGSSVTVWIEGQIQPRPTVRITSPARAAMLSPSGELTVTGEACHVRYPIVELVVNGVAHPVGGGNLCEPFTVQRPVLHGMDAITVFARNSSGRSTFHVQSYLRSTSWYPIALDAATVSLIPRAYGLRINPAGIEDFVRGDVDELSTVVAAAATDFSLNDFVGPVIATTEPDQPVCRLRPITRTGYRVERESITAASREHYLDFRDRALRSRVFVEGLVMTVVVRGYRKTSCETPVVTFTRGTITREQLVAIVHSDMFARNGLASVTGTEASTSTTPYTLTLNLSAFTFLSTAALDSIRDAIIYAFEFGPVNGLRNHLLVQAPAALDAILEGFRPGVNPSLADLGLEMRSSLSFLRAVTTGDEHVYAEWDAQPIPLRLRSGAGPPRGPIRFGFGPVQFSDDQPAAAAATYDLLNAFHWAAWQAGAFDLRDLFAHPAATPRDGLSARLRSSAPPVLGSGNGGRLRVTWGDLRLDLEIDPAAFGDTTPALEPVSGFAYATVFLEGYPRHDFPGRHLYLEDPELAVLLQLPPFPNVLIDEAAVENALRDALAAVAPVLIARSVAAVPLPGSTTFAIPGLAATSLSLADPDSALATFSSLLLAGPFIGE